MKIILCFNISCHVTAILISKIPCDWGIILFQHTVVSLEKNNTGRNSKTEQDVRTVLKHDLKKKGIKHNRTWTGNSR